MTDKKYSFRRISLRLKFLMVILPVLISSLVISSYLSSLIHKKSLIKTGIEFTGYKAEQLTEYSNQQWSFLVNNSLSENSDYLAAVKETVKLYAESMITKDDEIILAVNKDGNIEFSTKQISVSNDEIKSLLPEMQEDSRWLDIKLSGIKRTGLYFYYSPFNWHVFIIRDADKFYSTISEINMQQMIIIAVSLFSSVFLITLLVRYMTRPLKKIADEVTSWDGRFKNLKQIEIDFPDEIGELAFEFNLMSSKLKKSYYKLKEFADHESAAREEVFSREMETLEVLGSASDYRDPETGAHIIRVGHYSKMLASCLREDKDAQDLIFMASPLHDIGKLGIPDTILLKPGRLTSDEFEIMKTHTKIGYDILKNSKSWYLRAGGEIALTHHEKYDGSGYPSGLKGNSIPLFGRIVCVADVFDALTSKRPYKDPWPLQKAFDFLESESGKSFDPVITSYFIENRELVESIFYENQEN